MCKQFSKVSTTPILFSWFPTKSRVSSILIIYPICCRSSLTKEPLIIGLFFGKWPMKIRHPMTLPPPCTRYIRHSIFCWKHVAIHRALNYLYAHVLRYTFNSKLSVYCNTRLTVNSVAGAFFQCLPGVPTVTPLFLNRAFTAAAACAAIESSSFFSSCIHMWVIRVWRGSFMCDMTHGVLVLLLRQSWRIHMRHDSFICDVTQSCAMWFIHNWHDSSICDMTRSWVAWLIRVWRDSFMCDVTHSCATWLIHMRHDSLICDMTQCILVPFHLVSWLIRTRHGAFKCDMTTSYVTWLIHVWHDSFVRDMAHSCVTWLLHMW